MYRLTYGLVLFVLVLNNVAWADSKKKPAVNEDRTYISSIDLSKNKIELRHGAKGIVTVYVLAPDVVVQINDKPSTVKALQVGMMLHLMTLGSGMDDPPVIEEIDIGK